MAQAAANRGVETPLLLAAALLVMTVTLGLVILGFIHPMVCGFFPVGVANIKEPKALLAAGVMRLLPASEQFSGAFLEWNCSTHVVFFVSVL